jgi:wingless-type MMTV integration site family protein 7
MNGNAMKQQRGKEERSQVSTNNLQISNIEKGIKKATKYGSLPLHSRRRSRIIYAILYLHVFFFFDRTFSSVIVLGASIICSKIPGLAPKQRILCQSHPDAMVAVGEGVKVGFKECQYQFRNNRWNCTNAWTDEAPLGRAYTIGCRETAFTYAIRSAAIAYSITHACSLGSLMSCGCDQTKFDGRFSAEGWKWGGCSADIQYGLKFSRIFVDSREVDEDSGTLMNLHNNGAGRKALKDSINTECKCHGVSGSCSTKTCWTTLARFRVVGDKLSEKYNRAKFVEPIRGQRAMKPVFLKLKKTNKYKKPSPSQLVFLHRSPNFCEYDLLTGSLGTQGRLCNKTGTDSDGCDSMCCGRGYNTHQYIQTWQCDCKFHWCCLVSCRQCSQRTEQFTCK